MTELVKQLHELHQDSAGWCNECQQPWPCNTEMAIRRTELAAEKQTGLEKRYMVERINDPDGTHNNCDFFVLDLRHDPLARDSALDYAERALAAGYNQLSYDLAEQVRRNLPVDWTGA